MPALQVIVVGNGGVGKTSMIKRFCTGTFTGEYKKTIGVDFLQKKVFVPSQGETVTMDLWDTAGQEEFDTLTRNYYRGAQACVIVFSTTDRASFVAVENWKDKVEREVRARLNREINYWDARASRLREEERAGKEQRIKRNI